MAYTPTPYTTLDDVKRILRTSNNKIRIGNNPGEISEADINGFILDASRFIDGYCRSVIGFTSIPIPDYSEKMEVVFAAGRLACFFIYQAMYPSYRSENLGAGVGGWMDDAKQQLQLFKEHVNDGVYTDLSPATGGIQFITTEQFFQTQIGVDGVDSSLRSDRSKQVPIKSDNIGPYSDGAL